MMTLRTRLKAGAPKTIGNMETKIKEPKVKRFYGANKLKYAQAQADKYGLNLFWIHRNEGMDSIFVGTEEEWNNLAR